MLSRARVKLKNVESSIAFIQEQHAKTLEGLHQEIQKLQQKNASEWVCFPGKMCNCYHWGGHPMLIGTTVSNADPVDFIPRFQLATCAHNQLILGALAVFSC